MVGFIASKTKEIMFKCCEKNAKLDKVDLNQVQLILGLNVIKNGNGEFEIGAEDEYSLNKYSICNNYKIMRSLTIWQVLNLKPMLDFRGYSKLAPPFIFKALTRLAESYNIDPDKIFIMCQPQYDGKKPDMKLAIYNGFEFLKEIKFYPKEDEEDSEFEYLFNDEDMEMPQNT
jgi:hypothetical protein